MAADTALPRGRHRLTRDQVAAAQRLRLAVAMAEAMAEHGYVGTPVAAVLKGAGVSRQTFYELYDDKLACFLDALDLVGEVLTGELARASEGAGDPMARAERAVAGYLRMLIDQRPFARLYLVEVHAAGEPALVRRERLQARIVDALAQLFDADRFACQAFVAAVSALVTLPVVQADDAALEALRQPLLELLARLTA